MTGGRSRIYYTTNGGSDAGTSFSFGGSLPDEGGFDVEEAGTYNLAGELLGFALSPDGSKIYVGTVESGLWVANTSDMVFSQKNANVRVKCLATRNSELWACSDITSGFIVGESLDDGATFMPKMKYVTSVCGPVECSADSGTTLGCGATANAASCADAYQTFCDNDVTHSCGSCTASEASGVGEDGGGTGDGGLAPGDGGASPTGAGTGGSAASSSSCGCSVVGNRGATGLAAAGLALAAMALTRRRGSRR